MVLDDVNGSIESVLESLRERREELDAQIELLEDTLERLGEFDGDVDEAEEEELDEDEELEEEELDEDEEEELEEELDEEEEFDEEEEYEDDDEEEELDEEEEEEPAPRKRRGRVPGAMPKSRQLETAAQKRAASWTPEKKAAAAERMRKYWSKRKRESKD